MTQGPDRSLFVASWLGWVLAVCALSFMGVATLAPQIAADTQLPREAVGWFAGLVWGAGLAASLVTGELVRRWGPWPVTRLCLAACALGALAMASGEAMLFVLAALLIGVGQGLEAPPASQLLSAHVRVDRRPFYFSLKQTGVQIGAVTASLLMPLLALAFGWRAALLAIAFVLLLTLMALGRVSRAAPQRRASSPSASAGSQAWWALLREQRDIRRLAFAACAFGATQVCLNTFIVTWLIADRELSLTSAGLFAAAAQAAGLLGRPLWGWLASQTGHSIRVLQALGALMSLCAITLGVLGSSLNDIALCVCVVLFGLSASGWNGVFLSEVAERCTAVPIAAATAAAMVPLYLGLIAGPLLFAAISQVAHFASGFIALAIAAALGTLWLPAARQ